MKKFLVALLMAIAAACAPPPASAQSLTPGCSSPPPFYGVVWTASQWIVCLSSLQAQLGYTPLNIAGGSMSGELFLQPSVTTNAPLNFPPGSAPTSPANGDFWFTSAGAFYRAGGVTVGPLASTSSPTLASPTFTGTVTFPDGTTWTATTITASTALTAFWASPPVLGGTAPNTGTFTTMNATTGVITTARATTLAIGGATIGADALAVTGSASISGTVNLGKGSTDYAIASGGASGATLSTNGGSLTVSSGGGASTTLSDSTVTFSNAGYHSCGALTTGSTGNVQCSSAASFITYNGNVTTSTLAVSANEYCMNTGSGALTLTLPASPSNGAYVAFSDCGGNFGVNNLTIAGNGSNIMYDSGNMTVSTPYAAGVLRYDLGKTSWILQAL